MQPELLGNRHDVVIAGGGPTGLMLAAELALAKVDVAIVERRADQTLDGARSRGLHARTLETLDLRGLTERFDAAGTAMQLAAFGSSILSLADFPNRRNHGLAIPQQAVENLLAARVAELSIKTYRACEVTGFAQSDSGVDVSLSTGTDLRATFLVGCDGGRSIVRKQAGLAFPGWDASTSYVIAEVEFAETPAFGIRRDAKGTFAIGPAEGGRAGVVLRDDDVRTGETPTLDELRTGLIALYGKDFGLRRATWLSRFSDATRHAETYRAGRVLIAGDAAHIHSPMGGQGLNMGLLDAMNLGWKLAQVVRGTSPDSLLDTYTSERHPVTARALRLTMAQTALARGDDRTDALRATVGELLTLDEPRRRFAAALSGLDIAYDFGPGHPLLGRLMPDLELDTADGPRRTSSLLHDGRALLLVLGAPGSIDHSGWIDRVRRVDARVENTGESPWKLPVLGDVRAPSAVLVRPDGHVAWVGEGTFDGLRDALVRWFGAPG